MKYVKTLSEGTLIKRYKRFFADIEFNGDVITAHLPNTGSLKTVNLENTPCLFSHSDDPKRKLAYTLEMIKTDNGWAGVNTRVPNTITKEALEAGLRKQFKNIQSEVKISDKTRIDFVLYQGEMQKLKYPTFFENFKPEELHFIEVKNVTMKQGKTAFFPDGVTERGTKHLRELIDLCNKGYSTEILFTIQRQGCEVLSPAKEIDPLYAKTLVEAQEAGVQISAYEVLLSEESVELNTQKKIKINLDQ